MFPMGGIWPPLLLFLIFNPDYSISVNNYVLYYSYVITLLWDALNLSGKGWDINKQTNWVLNWHWHELGKWNLVHGVPSSQTMNHHNLWGAKQTGSVHEVCDLVKWPSSVQETPNSIGISEWLSSTYQAKILVAALCLKNTLPEVISGLSSKGMRERL